MAAVPSHVRETSKLVRTSSNEGLLRSVNDYAVGPELGRGAFAVVRVASKGDSKFALKIFSKTALKRRKEFVRDGMRMKRVTALDKALKELAIMKKVDHPHIVRSFEIIDAPDSEEMFLVLQLVEDGQAMDFEEETMTYKGPKGEPLTEDEARSIFRDVIKGIDYLHHHSIAHRDLKPENILLSKGRAILADLGVAHFFADEADDKTRKTGGTPSFCPPESCAGDSFSTKGQDIWAAGVCLYAFVTGKVPYADKNVLTLYEKIMKEPVDFSVVPEGPLRHLLQGMLEKDPSLRMTLDEIKSHPWVTRGDGEVSGVSGDHAKPITVTEDDIKKAITPRMGFDAMSKLAIKMRQFKRSARSKSRAATPPPVPGGGGSSKATVAPPAVPAAGGKRKMGGKILKLKTNVAPVGVAAPPPTPIGSPGSKPKKVTSPVPPGGSHAMPGHAKKSATPKGKGLKLSQTGPGRVPPPPPTPVNASGSATSKPTLLVGPPPVPGAKKGRIADLKGPVEAGAASPVSNKIKPPPAPPAATSGLLASPIIASEEASTGAEAAIANIAQHREGVEQGKSLLRVAFTMH